MPANLPPQYYAAEAVFRKAKTPEEKIAAIEDMIAIMPKHKGTDHLKAELRARIAKLSEESGKRATLHRTTRTIPREGAGQIVLVGPTNSGKSQLVARVTNAAVAVGDYAFTTRTATPGMMEFEDIKIQLVDMPAMAPQVTESWVSSVLKRADALLIVLDLNTGPADQLDAIIDQLAKMRLGLTGITPETPDILYWKPAVVVGNKADVPGAIEECESVRQRLGGKVDMTPISALTGAGIEALKRRLFDVLEVIRVYTKAPGEKGDTGDPLVLDVGSTVEDAARGLHKDFVAKLKYARVWGSGKHDGMMVRRGHILQDKDIIELHV
jgi:hypothetical protein